MAMGVDFLTTKEGPEVGNGEVVVEAVVVVVEVAERALVVVPELRVGHHLWRWNIDYFRIFQHSESSLDRNPFCTQQTPILPLSPKTKREYIIMSIYSMHTWLLTGRKNTSPGISQILFLSARNKLIHLFDSFTQVLYTLFLSATPNALLPLLNFINFFPLHYSLSPDKNFFLSSLVSPLYKVVK